MRKSLSTPRGRSLHHFAKILLLPVLLFLWGNVSGQVNITALPQTYSQDFNYLGTTPATFSLPNWYITPTGTLNSNAGTATAGACYNFGSSGSADRSLGGLSSGSATPRFGFRIKNNSSVAITALDVSFTGEQWKQTTAALQTLDLAYQISSSAITDITNTTGTWTTASALKFTALKTGNADALDGNATDNRTAISGILM